MKITIIHGQSHKGSTYNIAKILSEKLNGDITEFFLPTDFGSFCVGCNKCFMKSENECPHYSQLANINAALDAADVIILASPVYVYHVTGPMKAFLDHYGYRWMVHRPEEKMFSKQAVVISSAAGAGMKSTNKDMTDSLFFWGIAKIYKCGIAVREVSWKNVSNKIKNKVDKKTTHIAKRINNNTKAAKPSIKTKVFFEIMRIMQKSGWNKADVDYWKQKNWDKQARPWKSGNKK